MDADKTAKPRQPEKAAAARRAESGCATGASRVTAAERRGEPLPGTGPLQPDRVGGAAGVRRGAIRVEPWSSNILHPVIFYGMKYFFISFSGE